MSEQDRTPTVAVLAGAALCRWLWAHFLAVAFAVWLVQLAAYAVAGDGWAFVVVLVAGWVLVGGTLVSGVAIEIRRARRGDAELKRQLGELG